MKKEIRFSAKLDTQEFDRTVDNLQRRLRDIYSGTGQTRLAFENAEKLRGMGINPGANAPDAARMRQAEDKARRETDLFIRQQIKDQEKLSKQLNEQKNHLNNQIQLARELKKNGQERAEVEEKIVKSKEKAKQLEEQIAAKETAKAQAIALREPYDLTTVGARLLGIASGRPGIGGAIKAMPTALGMAFRSSPGSTVGGILGAAGTAVAAGSNFASQVIGAGPEANLYRGEAAAIRNQRMRSIFAGGGLEEAMFARERAQANSAANQATVANAIKDLGWSLGKSFMAGGAIAAISSTVGAVIGGAVGAVGGPIGVAAGATLGAKIGAGVGFIGGAATQYKNFATFPSRQEAFREAEREKQFQAFKEQSGLRKLIIEDFLREAPMDIATQRGMGLSDAELAGFYGRGSAMGFSRESMRQSGAGILGAGGTTTGARNLSGYALQLQRDYDLTNAQQLLGRISGVQGGSEEAARRSIAAIFEGSVKAGLDKSEFREENRKFADAVSEAIYRTGAADPLTQMLLSERRAGFVADKTTRGLEAAKSAADFMSQREKESRGLGAALEIGGMQSAMPSLDMYDLQALQNMTYEEILAMPEEMKAYYARKGVPYNKLLKAMEPLKELKTTGQPGLFEPVEKLKKLKDKDIRIGISSPEKVDELMGTKGEVMRSILSVYGPQGATPQIAKSMAEKLYAGQGMTPDEAFQKAKAEAGLPGASEQRAPDLLEQAKAAMDSVMVSLRNDFNPEVGRSADQLRQLNEAIKPLVEQLREAVKKGDIEAAKEIGEKIESSYSSGKQPQPQAAPPKSGVRTRLIAD